MKKHTRKSSRKYSQLSQAEREELAILLNQGISIGDITTAMHRHRSTIYRELKRNAPGIRKVRYRAHCAQSRSDERKQDAHQRKRLKNKSIRRYIIKKHKEGWSPEIIAFTVSEQYPLLKTNHESIYQWINADRRDLIPYLAFHHRIRRNRASMRNKRAVRIPNRTMIDQRPALVKERTEAGHWEADTAVSRQSKAAVMAVVERTSRFLMVRKLSSKSALPMKRALIACLSVLPQYLRKTITFDNGTENVLHEEINDMLRTSSFFCNPYHSWEKGSIENRIGMLRRYFPKKTNWALISQRQLNTIVNRINNRPMKCLGFKTPSQVFVALRS